MNENAPPSALLSAPDRYALLNGRRSIRHFRPAMPVTAILQRLVTNAAGPTSH
jgi:hypothetical protein